MVSMINRYISIILVLIVLQSCDDEWIFDIPGCMDQNAINYDLNASSDNGSCYYEEMITEVITIDSSSYDEWIYFSLELGEVVEVSDIENSMDWDLGFKRNHIKTNGGISGEGSGCAIVDATQSWTNESFESTMVVVDKKCQPDALIEGNIFTYEGCYNPITHLFSDCVKNPALDNWGSFDSGYHFNINNYRFFVKRADGVYVKFWLRGYYNINQEDAQISITYQTMFDTNSDNLELLLK